MFPVFLVVIWLLVSQVIVRCDPPETVGPVCYVEWELLPFDFKVDWFKSIAQVV